MHSPTDPSDALLGCATSLVALAASFVPSEESLRIACLLLSMLASIATVARLWRR